MTKRARLTWGVCPLSPVRLLFADSIEQLKLYLAEAIELMLETIDEGSVSVPDI